MGTDRQHLVVHHQTCVCSHQLRMCILFVCFLIMMHSCVCHNLAVSMRNYGTWPWENVLKHLECGRYIIMYVWIQWCDRSSCFATGNLFLYHILSNSCSIYNHNGLVNCIVRDTINCQFILTFVAHRGSAT